MAKRKMSQDYKILWVLILIMIICFIILGFLFYRYFYAGTGTSKYGDRLDDIGNYPLDSKKLSSDITASFESEKSVDKVTVNVQGKVVYITINFNSVVKEAVAKSLATKALESLNEKDSSYYEVQFILTYSGSEETTLYPMFGTKNANSLKVVW